MAVIKLLAFLLFLCFKGTHAGDLCYTDNSNFEWCDWGCCDDYDDDDDGSQKCCEDSPAGLIVGITMGCIGLVAVIVSVVVVICCCLRKNPGRRGVVYQQNSGGTIVTTAGVHQSFGANGSNPPVVYGSQTTYPIQTTNVAPGTQKWAQAPPAYETLTH